MNEDPVCETCGQPLGGRVFVYGTLRKGEALHGNLEDSKFIGEATLKGNYELLDLGSYPGLVESQREFSIPGEVYEVDALTLKQLDHIEGVPTLFCRDLVPTSRGMAWTYFYQMWGI